MVAECSNAVPVHLGIIGTARFPLDSLGGLSKDVVLGSGPWGARHKININFNHGDGENHSLPKENAGSNYPGGLFISGQVYNTRSVRSCCNVIDCANMFAYPFALHVTVLKVIEFTEL